jgi:UDP-N-acetylmuramoyl-L-alanyl-D-glutamate--2,6-diaminopimelate ligase
MKNFIKKIIPENLLIRYHYCVAHLASWWYGYPSEKMAMIGITGTKGKTSTANFVWSVLSTGGYTTGLIGTANIRTGEKEIMNPYHMTMPAPFVLQRILRDMYRAGCTHVVMEATSEGMKLGRHIGIDFDIGVFTNLTPEHLPNHGGSFEKYKQAKGVLFTALAEKKNKQKKIAGKNISTYSIINTDDNNSAYYSSLFSKVITYGISGGMTQATHVDQNTIGTTFTVGPTAYTILIPGIFNVLNALPAIVVGTVLGLDQITIQKGIANLMSIPGRMESISIGQSFAVYVDYAHEKVSMNAVLDTMHGLKKDSQSKIIVLFGAQGGGRDKEKRKWMGHASGEKADTVILTSDDSYEEKPESIIADIAKFVREKGKVDDINLFCIPDRRLAIRKAFELAHNNDIVVVAGKGSEQFMITNDGNVSWDDRVVVREELTRLGTKG